MTDDILSRLQQIIQERTQASSDTSYTKALLEGGVKKCAKKFGEESAELIIAAISEDDLDFKSEAADVLYHLLVLLQARKINLEDVTALLESRMGQSGHEEKAQRQQG